MKTKSSDNYSILKKVRTIMKSTVYCRMGVLGQEVYRIELPWDGSTPDKEIVHIDGPFKNEPLLKYLKKTRGTAGGDIADLHYENGILTLETVQFSNRSDFTLTIGETAYPKSSFDCFVTDGLDRFDSYTEGDVVYRLYSPESTEPRPLLLHLHGGGTGGPKDQRDNEFQLTANYGPINIAMDYPEIYVLAPMAIENPFNPMAMGGLRKQSFDRDPDPSSGWSRDYLSKVIDIIRRMIREGKVDEKRVYVTGLSMGGAGCIRAMSVSADLFAAGAPVCPTMTRETFDMLRNTRMPVWVSSAYVDHTVYRHKYLTDAIIELKDKGHRNAHLTLFSPEELAKYDIGIIDNMPYEDLVVANHASWVLTYHNEHGILSWLFAQHK